MIVALLLILLAPGVVKSDLESQTPISPTLSNNPPYIAISAPEGPIKRVGDRTKNIKVSPGEVTRVTNLILATFPDAPIMVSIASAESGFDCGVRNPGSSASGCFQILKGTWRDYGCIGDVLDVEDNIACARKLYDKDGTRPWNESKYMWGKYLK